MSKHSIKDETSLHRIQQVLSLAADVGFVLLIPLVLSFWPSNRTGTRTPQYYSCYN